jgi:hypothetical protein
MSPVDKDKEKSSNKNQLSQILNLIAAKRFSRNEKIVLVIVFIILIFIGNYYFNNWIAALKSNNSVIVTLAPPVTLKLPEPIIIKPENPAEPVVLESEPEPPKMRDPFLSSKNSVQVKTAAVSKTLVELKLSGILWDEKIPSAIINSKIVKIGDLIEGKTVVDIEKNRVLVMEEGKILVIELSKQ